MFRTGRPLRSLPWSRRPGPTIRYSKWCSHVRSESFVVRYSFKFLSVLEVSRDDAFVGQPGGIRDVKVLENVGRRRRIDRRGRHRKRRLVRHHFVTGESLRLRQLPPPWSARRFPTRRTIKSAVRINVLVFIYFGANQRAILNLPRIEVGSAGSMARLTFSKTTNDSGFWMS